MSQNQIWKLPKSKWGIPERDIWSLGTMDQGSGQMGELLGRRRRRRRRRRHLEIQVDIQARKLYLEFPNWILTHMRDIRILIPGFYTEFRAGSI